MKDKPFAIAINMLAGIGHIIEFIRTSIRLPVRIFNCHVHGHEWEWHGGGFMDILPHTKNFRCTKCRFKADDIDRHKTVTHQKTPQV